MTPRCCFCGFTINWSNRRLLLSSNIQTKMYEVNPFAPTERGIQNYGIPMYHQPKICRTTCAKQFSQFQSVCNDHDTPVQQYNSAWRVKILDSLARTKPEHAPEMILQTTRLNPVQREAPLPLVLARAHCPAMQAVAIHLT